MSLVVVGTNHKFSPIEIREKFCFSKKRLKQALVKLSGYENIKAGVILSTCNRVEIYADVVDSNSGIDSLRNFICEFHYQKEEKVLPYFYSYTDNQALFHLSCVASGIDSQIIGEDEILGQVQYAYSQAKEIESTDKLLNAIFDSAIKIAQKVREKTALASGKVSLASILLELLKENFSSLKDKRILIIGVGKITQLITKYLKKEKVDTVFIANRTYEKAQELAKNINAEVVRFDKLKEKLAEANVIISATSSPHLILKKEDLINVKKPLLIIDLAIPRDIDPEARNINGIKLFCLDDLGYLIEKNLNRRKKELPKALKLIKEEIEKICLTKPLELELEEALLP